MADNYGQLVPTGGGDPIPLLKRKLVIGRRGGCDIALKYPNVSSRHCELELVNGYWRIRDVGSTNGIKVNGVRCAEKFVLPGELVTIAKFPFELHYEADPSAVPPPDEEEDVFAVSLMEKAGLSRGGTSGSRRPSTSSNGSRAQRPTPPKKVRQPRRSPQKRTDDDDALDYLNE